MNQEKELKQIRLWISPEMYLSLEEARVAEKRIDVNLRDFALEVLTEGLQKRKSKK